MTGTTPTDTIIQGDALTRLKELPSESVDCCITSPPYFGLRDYGVDGQIGLEESPEAYVSKLVEVFREIRFSAHLEPYWRDDGSYDIGLFRCRRLE